MSDQDSTAAQVMHCDLLYGVPAIAEFLGIARLFAAVSGETRAAPGSRRSRRGCPIEPAGDYWKKSNEIDGAARPCQSSRRPDVGRLKLPGRPAAACTPRAVAGS